MAKTIDKSKLIELSEICEELLEDGDPTEEELDYDDDAIELYDSLRNLKEALENMGY